MIDPIPTQSGDALILHKDGSQIHLVGLISDDGQQTVNENLIEKGGRALAIATARSLVMRGGRIYMKNTEAGRWGQTSVNLHVAYRVAR